jgi:biotin-(acetyl-CoA carboxylase) ligase
MANVVRSFIQLRKRFLSNEFLQLWQSQLAFIGKPIYITTQAGIKYEGIFTGVDNDGFLLLKEKSGRITHFPIGDVSLRPV